MKPATRFQLALGWAICLFLSPSIIGQSQTNAARSGTVSGNVKIKGKAAPGVVVGVRKFEANTPYEPIYKGKTDEEGNYQVRNVPPGSYDVYPSAPAYVAAPDSSKTKQIVLAEGETVPDINFSLVRGGVITGKVTDADGRALIQERVTLYRADVRQPQAPQQRPQLAPAGSTMTDDRGVYRFWGFAPGKFKVAAGTGTDPMSIQFNQSRPSYSQTFHPDAN